MFTVKNRKTQTRKDKWLFSKPCTKMIAKALHFEISYHCKDRQGDVKRFEAFVTSDSLFYKMLTKMISYNNYRWCISEYIFYDGKLLVSNVTCIMKRSLSVFHRNYIRTIAWKLAIWVVAFDNSNSSITNQIGVLIRRNYLGESKGYNHLCFKHYFVISHSNSLYIWESWLACLHFYILFSIHCLLSNGEEKVSLKGSSSKPPYFGTFFYFFLFIIFRWIWNILIWFTTAHKLKELFGIFTYEWLIQICIL